MHRRASRVIDDDDDDDDELGAALPDNGARRSYNLPHEDDSDSGSGGGSGGDNDSDWEAGEAAEAAGAQRAAESRVDSRKALIAPAIAQP